jgi:hypothetical protein
MGIVFFEVVDFIVVVTILLLAGILVVVIICVVPESVKFGHADWYLKYIEIRIMIEKTTFGRLT